MAWDVEYTDQFAEWWASLDEREQNAIDASVEVLEQRGPALGRPLVDSVHASRHSNMKELRPPMGNIRILFAFEPRRSATLLIGGDTTNRWNAWYAEMILVAERLSDEHLAELQKKDAENGEEV